jgi:hypothetical protein
LEAQSQPLLTILDFRTMRYFKTLVSLILTFLVSGCLDPFNPSGSSEDLAYLVIDGAVNSSDGTGSIKLSQTKPLNSSDAIRTISGAQVTLEEEDGNDYAFTETINGEYNISGVVINPVKKYRLKIITDSNLEYHSDFISVKETPQIDSVSWKEVDKKIEIYANTHDDSNNTRYYRWKYIETWQYTSRYASSIKYVDGEVVSRGADDDIYHCFRTSRSTDILIHSTTSLQNDVVKEFRLTSSPINSIKFGIKYSIEVEQYALTKEAYEYWELLKKTTENVGSLFDPQPSQVTGNLYCISDPERKAIGFFNIGTINKERIFIDSFHKNVVDDLYSKCEQKMVPVNQAGSGILLIGPVYEGITLIGFLTSDGSCIDCRVAGGTTEKPSFWP